MGVYNSHREADGKRHLRAGGAIQPQFPGVCDGCGKPLGKHWLFRPEKLQDVMYVADTKGRAPNGRSYCNRSQTAWAGSYHQRELRRTMVAGYEHSK